MFQFVLPDVGVSLIHKSGRVRTIKDRRIRGDVNSSDPVPFCSILMLELSNGVDQLVVWEHFRFQ